MSVLSQVLYCSFLIFWVVQLLMPPSESAAYLSRIRKTDFFQQVRDPIGSFLFLLIAAEDFFYRSAVLLFVSLQAMEHAKRQETRRRLQRAADNGSGPPLRKRLEKISRNPEVLMQVNTMEFTGIPMPWVSRRCQRASKMNVVMGL